jgi:ribosomal protein L40E
MTDRRKPGSSGEARPSEATVQARDEEVERALGRAFALGIPVASVAGALVAGALASVGSALLVLAAGALLGAIGLFWASVRTLSGDAPLPADFEMRAADHQGTGALVEEKRRLMRALKDLDNEHELGKIDDADYRALLAHYRDEAKVVMRRMDVQVVPFRDEAERLARDYLRERSVGSPSAPAAPEADASKAKRVTCAACSASNETDATFCKQCGSSMKKEQSGAPA